MAEPERLDNDDLTPDEARDAEDTGMSGEEAHRYEEFRDLKEALDNGFADVMRAIDGLKATFAAQSVASGAVVTDGAVVADVDDDGDLDIVDVTPDIDGADLTLDDIDDKDL